MKTIYNTEFNFKNFEAISENEMLQVRGGTEIRPKTRELDIVPEDEG